MPNGGHGSTAGRHASSPPGSTPFRDAVPHDRTAHAPEWARIFEAGPDDGEQIWQALATAVGDTPVSTSRDRAPHGVVCGVEMTVTINDRTASVATAWHYVDEVAAPRLVTAYPSP